MLGLLLGADGCALRLGVMSLAWTALIAALIAFEKTLPWGRAVTWATATVLLALAVALVAVPHSVPDSSCRAHRMAAPTP